MPAPPPPPPVPLWSTVPSPLPKRATFGQILGDMFSVFAKDVGVYILVFLLYGAVTVGLSLAIQTFLFPALIGAGATTEDFVVASIGYGILGGIVNLVIASIVTASITHFAIQRYRGTPVPLGAALSVGLKRFLSVMGASIVQGLLLTALLAVGLAVMVAGLFALNLGLVCGGAVLVLALLPVAIYLTVALSLYAPAIVVEGKTAFGGLARSWELTRGRRLTLFLVLLVLAILIGAIMLGASAPFLFVNDPSLAAIGEVVGTMITGSWSVIVAVVAYHLIVTEPPPVAYPRMPPPYMPSPYPPYPPATPPPRP